MSVNQILEAIELGRNVVAIREDLECPYQDPILRQAWVDGLVAEVKETL